MVDTDPEADSAMALYIYAVGSSFEVILNNHMITGQPVYPPGLKEGVDGNLKGPAGNGNSIPLLGSVTRLLQYVQ